MIVDKFKLRSETYGDIAVFDFNNIQPDTPYILTGATGLGAENIVPLRYDQSFYGVDFYSMSLETREITLKVALNPAYSSTGQKEDLRDNLYRAIYSTYSPSLWFDLYNGSTFIATINGLVTKMDAALFTSKPEVEITLKCYDPLFKSPTPTNITSSAFSGGVLTLNYAQGTAPIGFNAFFTVLNPIYWFALFGPNMSWRFQLFDSFLAGDIITLSSIGDSKNVSLTRGSTTFKIANRLSSISIWPLMFPGNNVFTVATSGSYSDVSFQSASYYASYWGV